MKLQNDVGRSCGECTACCKPFPVPEVGKQGSDWCHHCTIGKGCNIYADRPLACRLFACAWLNGLGDEGFRPDRLGVMIDVQDVQLGERTVGILHFWEMREGAIGQPVIRRMAETNKDAGFIVAYHRILTQTTYATQMSMRKHLFTEKEFEMLCTRGL